jgi:DNA-binding MarR family transcriptional regulator
MGRPPLHKDGLSMPQFGLMTCVMREPGIRVQRVAEMLGVSTPTVSVAIRRMEHQGWLRRKHDPQDKRAARLYLSPKAQVLAKLVGNRRRKMVNEFMGALTDGEQEQLLILLEKATTKLEEKRKSTKKEMIRPFGR